MVKSLLAAAVLGLAAIGVGCETGPRFENKQQPALRLSRNHATIVTGETAAVFARTSNLLGREVEVRWSTSLGKITPAEGGRMAYFTSDAPGTAVVTAEMTVDGRLIRDHTNITVNAVR